MGCARLIVLLLACWHAHAHAPRHAAAAAPWPPSARSLLEDASPEDTFQADSSVDVIVIGAGWSGLYAARALLKANYSVAVFEARERVGGRSLRAQVSNKTEINAPLWVDEGGQWVGPDQTLAINLLDELGLHRYLSYHGLGQVGIFWKNQSSLQAGACWDCMDIPIGPKPVSPRLPGFAAANATEESPEPLFEAAGNATGELKAGMLELIRLMESFRNLTSSVDIDEPWKTPDAEALDSITFQDWVHARTSNEFARRMMVLAGSELGAVAEPWWASALHIARQQAAAPQPRVPEKWLVQGGTGQVPGLLADAVARAGGRLLLRAPVLLVRHGAAGVAVRTLEKASSARALVVAMPPHLTGRIEYQPPLSPLRDQLVQRVFMGSIIKVIAIYASPFWRQAAATNMSFVFYPNASGATEMAFDITPPADVGGGGSGVLASFITHRSPEYLDAPEDVVKAAVLTSFAQFFGPKALQPTAFIMKNWAQEPFTGGAYSIVMPIGAWTSCGKAWAQPIDNIHWAGTEVSNRWPGFYEGALQAANTAVSSIMAKVQPTGKYTGKWPDYKPNKPGKRRRLAA